MLYEKIIVSKIECRARRLVDVLEIRLNAIGLGIMLEGSNTTSEDWMSWKNQHAGGMWNMSKERVMY